ncbi:MAG: DUF2442 domain-containing protein [Caldilineaceae bacterium]
MTFPRVSKVEYLGDYRLRLTFTNGEMGEIDMRRKVTGRSGVFAPFNDVTFFAQVRMEGETVVWPNGVDLDPIVLYLETMHPGKAKTFSDWIEETLVATD